MGAKQRTGRRKVRTAKAGPSAKQTTSAAEPGVADHAKGPEAAAQKPVDHSKKHALWFHFIPSLVVVGMLALLKAVWLEETLVGKQVEQMAANLLQFRLAHGNSGGTTRVVVVDITSLLQVDNKRKGGERQLITPRAELKHVVQDVAAAKPKAIGIDVYFDLDANGQLSRDDVDFLDKCLDLRNTDNNERIPVFVGIYKGIVRGKQHWLEYPRFSDLGTAIVIPTGDDWTAPVSQSVTKLDLTVGGERFPATSLSEALYEAARKQEQEEQGRRAGYELNQRSLGLIEKDSVKHEEEFMVSHRFNIDFGSLDQIMLRKIPSAEVPEKQGLLTGKVVLIGRGTPGEALDMFNVPGRGSPVPGVYVHAAATDTLLERPLYTLSDWGHVLADILLMLIPLALIFLMEKMLQKLGRARAGSAWLPELLKKLPILMAVLVVIVGYVLINFTRFYWPDFLLVAIVLLFHNSTERFFKWAFQFVAFYPRMAGRFSR